MILEQFLTNQLFVLSIAKLASVARITPDYGKTSQTVLRLAELRWTSKPQSIYNYIYLDKW